MIESLLTFLFWFYLVPVLGLALIIRIERVAAGEPDFQKIRPFLIVPFINALIFVVLLVFYVYEFINWFFNLLAGIR